MQKKSKKKGWHISMCHPCDALLLEFYSFIIILQVCCGIYSHLCFVNQHTLDFVNLFENFYSVVKKLQKHREGVLVA